MNHNDAQVGSQDLERRLLDEGQGAYFLQLHNLRSLPQQEQVVYTFSESNGTASVRSRDARLE